MPIYDYNNSHTNVMRANDFCDLCFQPQLFICKSHFCKSPSITTQKSIKKQLKCSSYTMEQKFSSWYKKTLSRGESRMLQHQSGRTQKNQQRVEAIHLENAIGMPRRLRFILLAGSQTKLLGLIKIPPAPLIKCWFGRCRLLILCHDCCCWRAQKKLGCRNNVLRGLGCGC